MYHRPSGTANMYHCHPGNTDMYRRPPGNANSYHHPSENAGVYPRPRGNADMCYVIARFPHNRVPLFYRASSDIRYLGPFGMCSRNFVFFLHTDYLCT